MDHIQWYPNERVQLSDLELATGQLVEQDMARATRCLILPRGRSTGSAAAHEARVLSGFSGTVPGGLGTGTTLVLSSGKAILGLLNGADLEFGVVHGDSSPDSYTLDFSTASVGNYDVYVRYVQADSSRENRIFWNPVGSPAAEEVDTVYTQKEATWEAVYQAAALAPPGNGEWFRVYRVTIASGPVISALADYRHFFFEGSAATADGPYEQEWGDGTNDRNADRATYGLGDLHLWSQMVRRQLGEIIDNGSNVSHVKLPAIDLESAGVEHFGPGAAVPGAHKQVTLHNTVDSVKMQATANLHLAYAPAIAFWGSDYVTDTPVAKFAFYEDAGKRYGYLVMDPRGDDEGFGANGDTMSLTYFGNSFIDATELSNTNFGKRTLNWGGTDEVVIRMGSSAIARGIAAEQGAVFAKNGFSLWETKTVTTVIPLQWAADVRSSADGWVLLSDTSPTDSEAELYNCNVMSKACRFFINLPDGAIINYIDVMWTQDGGEVSSGNNMRMHAQLHRMGFTAVGDKPALSDVTDFKNLNSTQQFIEWAYGSISNTNIMRFTCDADAADRTMDQHTDQLVLSFVSPTAEAKDCRIHWIRVNFTYQWAQPYPVV
ncbi:MAG: hypothetical protein MUC88_00470 [Planctomycetes bacterium]|jgi:hypothetical protein|nr:hypothetical protein [Planctomycetota bacterium]